MAEEIPAEDLISRALFEIPGTIDLGSHFPFRHDDVAKERAESVYWRKYAQEIVDVHARGCALQPLKQARKPEICYVGARTAVVQSIRQIKSGRGHSFTVYHCREDGDNAHAHIAIAPASGQQANKIKPNDIRELVSLLVPQFAALESHSCPIQYSDPLLTR